MLNGSRGEGAIPAGARARRPPGGAGRVRCYTLTAR